MSKHDSLHALTRSFAKQTEEFVRHHEATYDPESHRGRLSHSDLDRAKRLHQKLARYSEHNKTEHLWKRVPRCDELTIWTVSVIALLMLLFLVVTAIVFLVKWF